MIGVNNQSCLHEPSRDCNDLRLGDMGDMDLDMDADMAIGGCHRYRCMGRRRGRYEYASTAVNGYEYRSYDRDRKLEVEYNCSRLRLFVGYS